MNVLVSLAAGAYGLPDPGGPPAAFAGGLARVVVYQARGVAMPSWWPLGSVAALALLYVGWKALLFLTALLERRPVVFFRPVADPAAVTPTDYVIARNAAWYEMGFTAGPLCVHAKGGSYRMEFVPWLAPDRAVAALVGGGSIVGPPRHSTYPFRPPAHRPAGCTGGDPP